MTFDLCMLAAGGGTRLRPLTEKLPKALLPLPGGITVIERLLERATEELELATIVIVVGYRADAIRARLGAAFRGVPIRYAENADWATTPNAESLVRAAPHLGERPTLLCDGDLVLAPGGLKPALPDAADLLLVVDSEVALDAEAMKVVRDGKGRVTALGKETAAGAAEFIGVSFWRDIRPLIAALRALPAEKVKYYEDGINHLLENDGPRVAEREIAAGGWVEIDTAEDYRRATGLDLDWSPHLPRLIAASCRAGDALARGALARLARPFLGRIGAGPSLFAGALLALAGIGAAWLEWPLAAVLFALLAAAGGMAEHYPGQAPRLLRLGRFLERIVDFGLPLALVAPRASDPQALLAAAFAAAALFLYHLAGISHLLIVPSSSRLAHPAELQAMNRAWLERGALLPLDRCGLLVFLFLCLALLPVVPALFVFAAAAMLFWVPQSIQFWRSIHA